MTVIDSPAPALLIVAGALDVIACGSAVPTAPAAAAGAGWSAWYCSWWHHRADRS